MSTQLQLRRGSTAQTAVFTGALSEVTVDTDQNTLVVHDGVTPGGHYIATQNFANAAFNAVYSLASGAYGEANSAYSLASGAYGEANSAYSLAQSAYNQANTRSSSNNITNGVYSVQIYNNGLIILPGNNAILDNVVNFSTTTPSQVLDSFNINQYLTAKYLIQATNSSDVHATEVLLTTNGTNIFISEYSQLYSSNLISISANLDTTNSLAQLIVTPLMVNTNISFIRTSLFGVAATGTLRPVGDLMLQSGTQDLMLDTGSLDLMV
jgi:hypothetical protein